MTCSREEITHVDSDENDGRQKARDACANKITQVAEQPHHYEENTQAFARLQRVVFIYLGGIYYDPV